MSCAIPQNDYQGIITALCTNKVQPRSSSRAVDSAAVVQRLCLVQSIDPPHAAMRALHVVSDGDAQTLAESIPTAAICKGLSLDLKRSSKSPEDPLQRGGRS